MKSIRITGVPEHFNYPILKFIQDQPFKTDKLRLEWIPEPKGSGAMNQSLRKEETEIAIILTESFVKDRIEGNPGKIIGYHVKSPLIWGIHSNPIQGLKNISDLKAHELKVLISRLGSGSHLMSYLLAKQEGWELNEASFKVINDLEGAKKEILCYDHGIFLWERFTTQPLVDQGYFSRIGEILTPWPCFVMVAHQKFIEQQPELVLKIRNGIYAKSQILMSNVPQTINEISSAFKISKSDIENWIKDTKWAFDPTINQDTLNNTLKILEELQLIPTQEVALKHLVHQPFIDLN